MALFRVVIERLTEDEKTPEEWARIYEPLTGDTGSVTVERLCGFESESGSVSCIGGNLYRRVGEDYRNAALLGECVHCGGDGFITRIGVSGQCGEFVDK
jgi:hypothetical protein